MIVLTIGKLHVNHKDIGPVNSENKTFKIFLHKFERIILTATFRSICNGNKSQSIFEVFYKIGLAVI